jgi:hypothetical protein
VFDRGGVSSRRDGPDVFADERLPFGALAEADRRPHANIVGRRKPGVRRTSSAFEVFVVPRVVLSKEKELERRL